MTYKHLRVKSRKIKKTYGSGSRSPSHRSRRSRSRSPSRSPSRSHRSRSRSHRSPVRLVIGERGKKIY